MLILDIRRASTADMLTPEGDPTNSLSPAGIIADELEWRVRPRLAASPALPCWVIATRWRTPVTGGAEARAATPDDCYVIGIPLRNTNMCFSLGGRVVLDGVVMPGTPLVAAPGTAVRCRFRGPCEELHLHASNELIAKCVEELPEPRPPAWGFEVAPIPDPTAARLARALLDAEEIGGSIRGFYADCTSIAIIARLLGSALAVKGRDKPREKIAPL